MEFDLEIPFNSLEAYQFDPVLDLFASESDHMPSRNFLQCLETGDFCASLRQQAISLILQAQCSCDYNDQFVSYLAINYVDRFFSRKEIPEGKPWILRLLVVSCLSLASKMKNTHFSGCNLLSEDPHEFNVRTINRMELVILDALNWRMRSITPFSFFSYFISLMGLNDNPSLEKPLKDRATEIVLKAQTEIKLLEFKPSIIAASALLLASHELFPMQFPSFKCSISSCEHVNKDKLQMCYTTLQELVHIESRECEIEMISSCTRRTPSSLEGYSCTNVETEGKFYHVSDAIYPHFNESESDAITGNSSITNNTSISDIGLPEKLKRRKFNGYC